MMMMTMENFAANENNNENNTEEIEKLIKFLLPTVVTVPTLALPTNTLVICVLLGKAGICSTSEIFTLNLALLDIIFCIMLVAEYVYLVLEKTSEATFFLAWGLNQAGGPLLLCLISLDSYMAVCHPLVFLRLKDPKLRLCSCLVVAAITVASCALVKLKSRFKWKVILVLLSSVIVVISTCNALILKSLQQAGPGKKEVHPVKKRAFKIVLTAFVLINIHYLPPVTEYLLREFGPVPLRSFSFLTCVAYLALSMGSFIQPLSYLIRTKQLEKVKCRCCC